MLSRYDIPELKEIFAEYVMHKCDQVAEKKTSDIALTSLIVSVASFEHFLIDKLEKKAVKTLEEVLSDESNG